jgi:hypothetical protein
LIFIVPVCAMLFVYMFCLFMANMNMDPNSVFVDKVRLLSIVILILFLQLCTLQIAT